MELQAEIDQLVRWFARGRVFVLTGAGCSTESGIPDYRDADGNWKRREPVRYQDFVRNESARRRYWARSFIGWPQMASAVPNKAHLALAQLERSGAISSVVTQNVDGLHQKAGSRRVIDLHGRLNVVVCLQCRNRIARDDFQNRLAEANPGWCGFEVPVAPDGDADLEMVDFSGYCVPPCPKCRGILKPEVVFFGENVPRETVEKGMEDLRGSSALLVAGSSLAVWSGYRFILAARDSGIPAGAVNLGRTRADDLLAFRIAARCSEILPSISRQVLGCS